MDAQQQLFGLMTVAEEHQKAVKAAIEALATEREAFAKGQAMLADRLAQQVVAVQEAAAGVSGVAHEVRCAANDAIPGLRKAAGEAAAAAVGESLGGASKIAVEALSEAAKPMLADLAGVVGTAGEVENQLRNAGAWASWKVGAALGGGVLVLALVAWGSVWWQRHQVEQLAAQKAVLQADVAELQANVTALEKKGGRIRLEKCGPDNRVCVEIARDQGGGSQVPYAGAWQSDDKQRQFVIPRGY